MARATGKGGMMSWLKRGLLALIAAAATMGTGAQAQDVPQVISPLRVESDHNGVNLVDGRTQIGLPTLSVPGAPNLRFDRVQNAAPYILGRVSGQAGEIPVGNWSVHTGTGVTESFVCNDWMDCDSVTGTGSYFRGPAGTNGAGGTYKQAGTSATWHFTLAHALGPGPVRQSYASNVSYPTGETISYTYDTAVGGTFGFTFYRPVRIESNYGFHIRISYQSSDFNSAFWGTVSEAAIYRTGSETPLRRITYATNGAVYTITDYGDGSGPPRVYSCSGCSNALGSDIETNAGSLTLPGEAAPARQVAALPATPLVGSVSQDGVGWNYAYTYNGGAPYHHMPSNSYWYTRLAVTGPDGFNQVYNFTISGQRNVMTGITDSIGRTTGYQFDYGYRPTRVTYPEGNQVSMTYDDMGNVVSRTTTPKPGSGLAAITESASYPIASCLAPAIPHVLCYRATWSRDGLYRQTDYVYNSMGQLTQQDDPADANGVRRRTIVEYTPSPVAAISRRTVARGCGVGTTCGTSAEIRTEYEYWGDTPLVTRERRIDGTTGQILDTINTYDSAGLLLSTDGPLAGTDDAVFNRYDHFGRKTWEIGALGANGLRQVIRTAYRDSDDKVIATEIGYIPADPQSVALTVQSRTDYYFDSRRYAIRDAVYAAGAFQSVTDRAFDDQGRPVCTAIRMNPAAYGQLPGACAHTTYSAAYGPDRITLYLHDNAGQRLQEWRAYGVTTANGFPANTQQIYATYTYSLNGQRTSVTDANNNRAEMTYDGFDRQRSWILPSPTTPGLANPADREEYGYDAAGNRVSLRKRDGSILTFQYDNLNRMIAKTVPERAGLAATHTRDVYYGYDLRNAQLFARFDSAGAGAEGVTNQYDGFGRLTSSALLMDGVSQSIGSGYDAGGRRVRVTQPDGLDFTYTYDGAGGPTGIYQGLGTSIMLVQFAYNTQGLPATRSERYGSSVTYGFDAVGRLTSQADVLVGGVNNVTYGFGRNQAGQITSRTRSNDAYAWTGAYNINRSYSANGLNQYTAAGTASFTYEANGNLTSDGARTFTYDVENRLVGASDGVTLRYDPLGRLYEVIGPSGTKRFVWDGDALVNETNSTGWLTDRYVHGAASGVDDPLVWYTGTNINFLHADHQGSIVAVTSYGTTPSINTYDEYGIPGAGNFGRFQYTGQIWLPELGMYHYKARIYSPTLGRFLQTDPVGYDDQINLYAYVGNDPVNNTDPTGTMTGGAGSCDTGSRIPGYSIMCRMAYEMSRTQGNRRPRAPRASHGQQSGHSGGNTAAHWTVSLGEAIAHTLRHIPDARSMTRVLPMFGFGLTFSHLKDEGYSDPASLGGAGTRTAVTGGALHLAKLAAGAACGASLVCAGAVAVGSVIIATPVGEAAERFVADVIDGNVQRKFREDFRQMSDQLHRAITPDPIYRATLGQVPE